MSKRARPIEPIATRLGRLAGMGVALGSLVGVPTAFQMLFAEPVAAASASQPSAHAIERASDGLFHAKVAIGGEQVDCLVDTGATDLTLSARTARRLGLDGRAPSASGRIHTASGSVRADRLTVDEVTLAGRRFADVPAVLVHGAPGPCLIGQALLARLDAVELHGDRLHLR